MSDDIVQRVEDAPEAREAEGRENLFRPLVQDAKSTLRRIMLNSNDHKMAARVAESILDRAGEGVRRDVDDRPTIVISESQVNLLVQTQRELLE